MTPSIAQVATAMQTILTTTAAAIGRQTGFVQRAPRLDGALLAQTFAFTMLANPTPSLENLCQSAAALGVPISPQALDQRLTERAATTLQQVLAAALQQVVATDPVALPLLARFPGGLWLHDSSTITLPPQFADLWRGCGKADTPGAAALKIQIHVDLLCGTLRGELQPGRASDRTSTLSDALPAEALSLRDLGYWNTAQLADFDARGVRFLARLHSTTKLCVDGQWWDPAAFLATHAEVDQLDVPVLLGKQQGLPVRLIAVRVAKEVVDGRRHRLREAARKKGGAPRAAALALAEWTIFVTNVPVEQLSLTEALVLARARWQIELLFKLWKTHGQVDLLRTVQRWRLLCELYGRLLAMVVQHWVLLTSCWAWPNRSVVKAAQTIRLHALGLAKALRRPERLVEELTDLAAIIAANNRLNRRKAKPTTAQLLADPSLLTLA